MTFAWMRRMDTVFGGSLSALVSVFDRKPRSFAGEVRAPGQTPRRVICTQFFGMGSVALSLPLLKSFKDSGARVAFWSFPGQAEIVRLSGLADEIWVIRPTLTSFLSTLIRTFSQARRFRPEAFVDLEPSLFLPAVLGWLSGAKIRCGFLSFRPRRDRLYTNMVSLERERHIAEAYQEFARTLGVNSVGQNPGMLTLPSFEGVENVLPRFNGRKRIVINVNASDTTWRRHWPLENWVELCDRLMEDRSIDLVFPGGFADQAGNQLLISKLKDQTRVYNLAGTITLIELLRVLREAELLVSVNSGLIHLAAWCGTPIVALFGPESPKGSSPLTKNSTSVWLTLACSPCVGHTASERSVACPDHQCMRRIDTDTIFRLSRRYLEVGRETARAA